MAVGWTVEFVVAVVLLDAYPVGAVHETRVEVDSRTRRRQYRAYQVLHPIIVDVAVVVDRVADFSIAWLAAALLSLQCAVSDVPGGLEQLTVVVVLVPYPSLSASAYHVAPPDSSVGSVAVVVEAVTRLGGARVGGSRIVVTVGGARDVAGRRGAGPRKRWPRCRSRRRRRWPWRCVRRRGFVGRSVAVVVDGVAELGRARVHRRAGVVAVGATGTPCRVASRS